MSEGESKDHSEFTILETDIDSSVDLDKGYYFKALKEYPVSWPRNWNEPMHFEAGSIYSHYQILSTPTLQRLLMQFCIWGRINEADQSQPVTCSLSHAV